MKKGLTALLLLITIAGASAQQSDFLVVKKHNNKTLRTYYEGSFLSAETYEGFQINGFIVAIRNDSILIRQYQTQLVGTQMGSKIDTLVYTFGFYYGQIKKFNLKADDITGRKKGFAVLSLPNLMIIGGIGFITLELVNTAYRHESLTENNKLASLGIAAGVAAAGFIWKYIAKSRNKVGGKYKMVYVKAHAIK